LVRPATPGEFSARAFLNAKIDLTEAEGIAATIHATDQLERKAAASLRNGHLHQQIDQLTNALANLLALVEAGIDFSDEEGVSFIDAEKAETTLEDLAEQLDHLLSGALRLDRLHAPPTVAFIGAPNVGKSSLLNALTGQNRSIVSPIPGTTRDILAVTLHTPRGDIRLLDLPGDEIPSDELRTKMMDARALALSDADLVVRIIDHPFTLSKYQGGTRIPADIVVIQNKADTLPPESLDRGDWLRPNGRHWGQVSAKTGYNLPKLIDLLTQLTARSEPVGQHAIALNQRHRAILQETKTTLYAASIEARDPHTPELLASHLRHALDLLGQITGAISPDQILGRIFSTFCIGK
jgi:tRNA modification GTPase